MDRFYMLHALNVRIRELKDTYRGYVNNIGGWSKQYCTVRRSVVKKELNICMLVKFLLEKADVEQLTDPDAIDGFQKLVEPVNRGR